MTPLVVENEPPVTFLRRKMTGGRFSMGVVIRRYTGANPQVTGHHCKFPRMSDIEVGVEGVSKLLKNLKTDKAAGQDQIRPVLLKELHSELSPVITLLFQLSLDKGCLPSDWVTANVTPLFKKGDRTKPSNYRPISLTCILCDLKTCQAFYK